MRGKKGDAGTLETVGAIILVIIFVLLITGGGQQIWASFREMTSKVKSCEGMGFAGGVCVASDDTIDCTVQIQDLGCKGNQPICCFRSDSEAPASSSPIGLIQNSITLNPSSARIGQPVIISCNTNTESRGCIFVEYGTNNRLICQSETWTAVGSGTSRVNQVQFSCFAPAPIGNYALKCKVDVAKCNFIGSHYSLETEPINLIVN